LHRMKHVLRPAGLGLILGGPVCMPFPVTNPEASTSIFPWLAMTGGLVKFGAWAIAIGALILALSFAVRDAD
jgi:hypothetical protein